MDELIKSLKGAGPGAYGLPSGKQVALVVGVNIYSRLAPAAQLKTASGDASAIADALRRMGFDVTVVTDPDRSVFFQTWEKFRRAVDTDTITAFFFAGHGIQMNHVNYLLLGDTPSESMADDALIRRMAVNFNELRDELHERRPRLSLYILDACRNNPYKGSPTRTISQTRGLAKVEAGKGTFIMYSAETGEEALDRLPGDPANIQNSIYTRRLIPLLAEGDLTLQAAAQRVRAEVLELAKRVNHSQTPAYYDGLVGLVCLSSTCSKSAQVLSSK